METEEVPQELEKSKNTYSNPYPKGTKVKRVSKDCPAHLGPFKGAIDIVVPLGTPVLSPSTGKVVNVVDIHDKFGPSEEFKDYLNYITILHPRGEYSQLAHLAKGSAGVKVGDIVKEGQKIAITGNSGWMTGPHIHMLVFKLVQNKDGFKGLEIKFKE